jgi:hypothetical protein
LTLRLKKVLLNLKIRRQFKNLKKQKSLLLSYLKQKLAELLLELKVHKVGTEFLKYMKKENVLKILHKRN